MLKKENDRFIGMWHHPTGGWEIRYQQNGQQHSEYRHDENEARLRSDYWKATLEDPSQAADSSEEHPVLYWERILRRIAELVLSNPSDRDVAATCRALASAAQAAMRTAKYIPAPRMQASPDAAPVSGDVGNLTTEQLQSMLAKP